MTREEAKRRLLNIERCTPIHTREDVRDFEALEMAIKALELVTSYEGTINKLTKAISEQEPKTGHWIEVIDEIDSLGNKTWHHKCSICGNERSGWGEYKYCPECGAKMKGGE